MRDYILQGDQEVAQYDMLLEQLCQSWYNSSPAHARVAITGASAISKLIPDDVSGSISYPTLHLSLSVIRYLNRCYAP
jgi:hypothetical protein